MDKPKYNHAFDIGFTVESNDPEGKDITPEMFASAIRKRVDDLMASNRPGETPGGEILEAVGAPFDIYWQGEGEEENKINSDDWTLTDPDNFQYGRKLALGVYEFKEFDRNNYTPAHAISKSGLPDEKEAVKAVFDIAEFWVEETVVLSHYSQDEIENHVSAYYASLDDLKVKCGRDWEWIVAEIIFEQTCGLY